MLSGGVDSVLLFFVMVRLLKAKFRATTVGFGRLSPDQMQAATVLAELAPQERLLVSHK